MCDRRSPVRISSLNVFQALSHAKSLKDKAFLHDQHDHRKAGNKGRDGSECGNITKKVSHRRLPCSLVFLICSLFVRESTRERNKNTGSGRMVNRVPFAARMPPLAILRFSVSAGTRRVPRIEVLYVTHAVSRSVVFPRNSGPSAAIQASFETSYRMCATHARPSLFRREADHFLRSPRLCACITALDRITGPTSPAMRAGVAEAGRGRVYGWWT